MSEGLALLQGLRALEFRGSLGKFSDEVGSGDWKDCWHQGQPEGLRVRALVGRGGGLGWMEAEEHVCTSKTHACMCVSTQAQGLTTLTSLTALTELRMVPVGLQVCGCASCPSSGI